MPKNSRPAAQAEHPEWTKDMLRNARPLGEVLAESKRRGRPPKEDKKVMVSIRLEPKLVDAYRSTGRGWQGRMRDTLEAHAPKVKRAARRKSA